MNIVTVQPYEGLPEQAAMREGCEVVAAVRRRSLRLTASWLLVGSLAALAAGKSHASEPWVFQAYQPFLMQDGIAISPMTYTGYFSSEQVVEMACWANRVWHQHEGKSFQENAAFMAGLTASLDALNSWPNRGDTIAVVLDLSRAHAVPDTRLPGYLPHAAAWPDESLVLATIECMKANAAQLSPVRYLAVRIVGPRELTKLGGVFPLEGSRHGPERKQF